MSLKQRSRIYPVIAKDFNILFKSETSLEYFIAAKVVIHFDQILHFHDDFRKLANRENIPEKYAIHRPFAEEKPQIIRILGSVQVYKIGKWKVSNPSLLQIKTGKKTILPFKCSILLRRININCSSYFSRVLDSQNSESNCQCH